MNTEEKVINLLKKISANDNIKTSDTLESDLGFDSLSLVLMMLDLEEIFEIEFNPEDMNAFNLESVDSVVNLVKKYIE